MRIRTPAIVAGLMFSTAAHAADHLMHVDEVLLDGGAGEQFIELHDTGDESLPNGPYSLRIYNGGGTMVDSITLTGITGASAAYYTVGNAAAVSTFNSVTFNGTLANPLPDPGQACFVRNSNSNVHCVAWGCPSAPLTGVQSAMAPGSGTSLTRQASGQLHFAIATPDAANSAGTLATACPGPVLPDAGVTPDAGSGNPNNPDAGTGGGGGSDDDSGCCQSSAPTSTTGAALLSMLVLGTVLKRRRRS